MVARVIVHMGFLQQRRSHAWFNHAGGGRGRWSPKEAGL
jgi:hypothetical protein